jgi:hypothetical protein
MSDFTRWLRRKLVPPFNPLSETLSAYPPYLGLYPGDCDALLPGQAEANLAHLLAHRQERVEAVLQLLAARGVPPDGALGQGDPVPFLDRLWKWIEAEWPSIHSKGLARRDSCRNPRGDGAEKALSLVTDVGILLGEIVLVRRPAFGWALDLAPGNQGENGSVSQKQPVVLRAGNTPRGNVMFDPIGAAESMYVQCKSQSLFLLNDFAGAVMDILGGAKERAAAERERLTL